MRIYLLVTTLAFITTTATAGGPTTWRVGDSTDPACDFNHLQDAIDEAASECTFASPCVIELSGSADQHRGNTYTIDGADLAGNASQLFITGGFDNCSANEPSGQTVLDADGNGRVFTIRYLADFIDPPAFTTHLSNVLVTGGSDPDGGVGGGIMIEGRSGRQFVRMNDVNINGNSATHGGGISIRASSHEPGVAGSWIVMTDSIIANNTALSLGGGIDCTYGTADSNNPIEFNNVRVLANSATSGGGAFISNCINLEFNTNADSPNSGPLSGNLADGAGGGIFMTSGEATVRATGDQHAALLAGNSAENGGAAFITGGSALRLFDVRAAGNEATQRGGAFYVVNGSLLIMRQSDGKLSTAQCPTPDNPLCSGITENRAVESHGGGLYLENATAHVSQSIVRGNISGGLGSAGFVRTATLSLEGTAIFGNFGSSRLFQIEDGNLGVLWSTIAGNDPNDGATLQVFRLLEGDAEPALQVLGSIIWQPGANMINASGNVSSSATCAIGHIGSSSSFDNTTFYSETDPRLADVEGGDLRLQADSPAIDYCGSGDVAFLPVFDDLFGNERGVPFNQSTQPAPNPGDGDFDLGAHEQQPVFGEIFDDRFEEHIEKRGAR